MQSIQLENYQAGTWKRIKGYTCFVPSQINAQWTWQDFHINTLLEKASIKLGELNSFARLVPNIDLFIQLHVTKEAVISSRIEGTQTNIGEAFLPFEEIQPERREDWKEVKNYTEALDSAIDQLAVLPLSSRLIRYTHKILLQGVRGKNKLPGEFRESQNWIGGYSLADAVFVPPAHSYVPNLMSDLEKFLHNEYINVPALIKIGIAHYQFETIHPFLDGNGRIGRLLIPLFLVHEQILHKPLLYLSSFFEKDKGLYYDNLMNVRLKNNMTQWLKYFLVGIADTAQKAVQTLTEILELKQLLERRLHAEWGRRLKRALILLEYLFTQPVIHVKNVEQVCSLSAKAANSLIKSFESAGILKEQTGQSRNRIFVFEQYLALFQ